MEHEQTLKAVIKTITDAIDNFNASIPATQDKIFNEVNSQLKLLDMKGDNLQMNINNIRIIGNIRDKINKIVLNPQYIKNVGQYLGAFGDVTDQLNTYYETHDFTPSKFLKELQGLAVDRAAETLTENGVKVNLSDKIYDILRTNITTGAKFTDLSNQMKDYIKGNNKVDGALVKYASTYTTQALNIYAAQYNQAAAFDLELEYRMYDGAIIKTSRCWCIEMVNRKYCHVSEFEDLITAFDCDINADTDLPYGMIAGTNGSNLEVNRGGWNCGHQFIPVSALVVPKDIRMRFEGH